MWMAKESQRSPRKSKDSPRKNSPKAKDSSSGSKIISVAKDSPALRRKKSIDHFGGSKRNLKDSPRRTPSASREHTPQNSEENLSRAFTKGSQKIKQKKKDESVGRSVSNSPHSSTTTNYPKILSARERPYQKKEKSKKKVDESTDGSSIQQYKKGRRVKSGYGLASSFSPVAPTTSLESNFVKTKSRSIDLSCNDTKEYKTDKKKYIKHYKSSSTSSSNCESSKTRNRKIVNSKQESMEPTLEGMSLVELSVLHDSQREFDLKKSVNEALTKTKYSFGQNFKKRKSRGKHGLHTESSPVLVSRVPKEKKLKKGSSDNYMFGVTKKRESSFELEEQEDFLNKGNSEVDKVCEKNEFKKKQMKKHNTKSGSLDKLYGKTKTSSKKNKEGTKSLDSFDSVYKQKLKMDKTREGELFSLAEKRSSEEFEKKPWRKPLGREGFKYFGSLRDEPLPEKRRKQEQLTEQEIFYFEEEFEKKVPKEGSIKEEPDRGKRMRLEHNSGTRSLEGRSFGEFEKKKPKRGFAYFGTIREESERERNRARMEPEEKEETRSFDSYGKESPGDEDSSLAQYCTILDLHIPEFKGVLETRQNTRSSHDVAQRTKTPPNGISDRNIISTKRRPSKTSSSYPTRSSSREQCEERLLHLENTKKSRSHRVRGCNSDDEANQSNTSNTKDPTELLFPKTRRRAFTTARPLDEGDIPLLSTWFTKHEKTVEEILADQAKSETTEIQPKNSDPVPVTTEDKYLFWQSKFFDNVMLNMQDKLHISDSYLESFPEVICDQSFSFLTLLDINSNTISVIPPEIHHLSNLKELNLSHNLLSHLPEQLFSLPKLKMLDVSNNSLMDIPCYVSKLVAIEDLILAHNKIEYLPEELFGITSLLGLSLKYNKLDHHSFPSKTRHFSGFVNLLALDLSHNTFGEIPPEICSFTTLQELEFSHNKLTYIREENFALSKLTNLLLLDLSFNQLTTFGDVVSKQLCALRELVYLSIAHNDLEKLPKYLYRLKHLNSLLVHGNPRLEKTIPKDTLEMGTESILQFLKHDKHKGKKYELPENRNRNCSVSSSVDITDILTMSGSDSTTSIGSAINQSNEFVQELMQFFSTGKVMKKDVEEKKKKRNKFFFKSRLSNTSLLISPMILPCSDWEIEMIVEDRVEASITDMLQLKPSIPGPPLIRNTSSKSLPSYKEKNVPGKEKKVKEKTAECEELPMLAGIFKKNLQQEHNNFSHVCLEREADYSNYYHKYFYSRAHINLFGRDPFLGPIVLSITKERDAEALSHWFFLRTPHGNKLSPIQLHESRKLRRYPPTSSLVQGN